MISRVPPSALRRRAGFLAIATLLAGGLYVAGGQSPVRAATQAAPDSVPPSVDISYKNRNPPRYPEDAIKKGEQGSVILDVTVDATGRVVDVRVDQNGTNAPASLQLASIEAAQNWKFNPGRRNGKPVGGVLRIPVNFALNLPQAGVHTAKPCPAGDVFDVAAANCIPIAADAAPAASAR